MKVQLTRKFYTETAHRLLNYGGDCGNIHGHSYKWLFTFEDRVNEKGFVTDFKDLKSILSTVEGEFDHALILNKEDPLSKVLITAEPTLRIICFDGQPTVENMARYAKESIESLLLSGRKTMQLIKVGIHETVNCSAEVIS